MTFYAFARSLCHMVTAPIYHYKVIGKENFPTDGGVLLCANHIHALDPIVVGVHAPRPVHYMAKEELFSVPILGKIISNVYAFPVKRGLSDREALRKGLSVLKEGHVLGLFPEGTRSKTGELGKALAGAGFFALRTNAAVVPCAIIGPYKAFRPIKVIFGEPIDLSEARQNKISAEETSDIIMNEIQKLINTYK
ncbi:1-acyl-sn-glycerol-3-phosphate acyltransferase [Bacillus sp. DNRA2]|uniref:lysophospholipid acyltransferase family protein n=1 Tax=Bacillus sp. DNRA2 TaxID=2723053 RepID=UPI00145D77AA|nr:lysophospholipid acyltransferase family protein [Bacillus sp. DNRA2]NMD70301.1 1-acyl-sn-glycerol-3-phosphate acyltransferase [Bacillus sp. DNRA2]